MIRCVDPGLSGARVKAIDPAAPVRSRAGDRVQPPLPFFFLHDLVNFGRTVQEQGRLERKHQ